MYLNTQLIFYKVSIKGLIITITSYKRFVISDRIYITISSYDNILEALEI